MPVTKDHLEALFAQLRIDHAETWQQISMSDLWRKLQALEGKLELLTTLIKNLEQPAEE